MQGWHWVQTAAGEDRVKRGQRNDMEKRENTETASGWMQFVWTDTVWSPEETGHRETHCEAGTRLKGSNMQDFWHDRWPKRTCVVWTQSEVEAGNKRIKQMFGVGFAVKVTISHACTLIGVSLCRSSRFATGQCCLHCPACSTVYKWLLDHNKKNNKILTNYSVLILFIDFYLISNPNSGSSHDIWGKKTKSNFYFSRCRLR